MLLTIAIMHKAGGVWCAEAQDDFSGAPKCFSMAMGGRMLAWCDMQDESCDCTKLLIINAWKCLEHSSSVSNALVSVLRRGAELDMTCALQSDSCKACVYKLNLNSLVWSYDCILRGGAESEDRCVGRVLPQMMSDNGKFCTLTFSDGLKSSLYLHHAPNTSRYTITEGLETISMFYADYRIESVQSCVDFSADEPNFCLQFINNGEPQKANDFQLFIAPNKECWGASFALQVKRGDKVVSNVEVGRVKEPKNGMLGWGGVRSFCEDVVQVCWRFCGSNFGKDRRKVLCKIMHPGGTFYLNWRLLANSLWLQLDQNVLHCQVLNPEDSESAIIRECVTPGSTALLALRFLRFFCCGVTLELLFHDVSACSVSVLGERRSRKYHHTFDFSHEAEKRAALPDGLISQGLILNCTTTPYYSAGNGLLYFCRPSLPDKFYVHYMSFKKDSTQNFLIQSCFLELCAGAPKRSCSGFLKIEELTGLNLPHPELSVLAPGILQVRWGGLAQLLVERRDRGEHFVFNCWGGQSSFFYPAGLESTHDFSFMRTRYSYSGCDSMRQIFRVEEFAVKYSNSKISVQASLDIRLERGMQPFIYSANHPKTSRKIDLGTVKRQRSGYAPNKSKPDWSAIFCNAIWSTEKKWALQFCWGDKESVWPVCMPPRWVQALFHDELNCVYFEVACGGSCDYIYINKGILQCDDLIFTK